jgi:hypothetical protein
VNHAETEFRAFGNLIARCRRDALCIISDGAPNMQYRLGLIGERLMSAFNAIDASTTREQRLMLIGANPVDAPNVAPGKESMLHLIWAYSLEWSAMRRGDEWIATNRAPLYWAVGFVMFDHMKTDEARPSVDEAFRLTFGVSFDDLAEGGTDD